MSNVLGWVDEDVIRVTRAVADAPVAFGGDRPFRCPTKALVASARA